MQILPLQTTGLLQIIKLGKPHFLFALISAVSASRDCPVASPQENRGWSAGPLCVACLVATFHESPRASRNLLEALG